MKVVDIFTDGKLSKQSAEYNLQSGCVSIFDIALLCNKARYGRDATGVEKIFGDPTEIGLIESAEEH